MAIKSWVIQRFTFNFLHEEMLSTAIQIVERDVLLRM